LIVVSLLSTRFQTPILKRCTNSINGPKDATFDFLIYLSLADKLGMVEFVVWDQDMLTKEYLSEVALPLEDWLRGRKAWGFGSMILVIRWVRHSRWWLAFSPKLI
jgi:phosphatidylserine decarboxylase